MGVGALDTVERRDLLARVQVDIRHLLQPAHQILRHRLANVGPSIDHMDRLCGLGEENSALASRVPGADNGDFRATAKLRFHRGGSIIDAPSLIPFEIVNRQPAILGTCRHDNRLGLQLAPIGQPHAVDIALPVQRGGLDRRGNAHPELQRLNRGTFGEFAARHPRRESKIVLDLRRGSCLPARPFGIQRQHRKPFRGGIDCGSEACRPGPHHDNIGRRPIGQQVQPERFRDVVNGRLHQHVQRSADHHRQLVSGNAARVQQRSGCTGLGFRIKPGVGNVMPVQQVAGGKHRPVLGPPDHDHARPSGCAPELPPCRQDVHEHVRQGRILNQQLLEPVERDVQHLACDAHFSTGQRRLALQDRDIAGKLSPLHVPNPVGAIGAFDKDVRLATQGNDEIGLGLSLRGQRGPRRVVLDLAIGE